MQTMQEGRSRLSRKPRLGAGSSKMHWTVATPFEGPWLVPSMECEAYRFTVVERRRAESDWHARTSKYSGRADWQAFCAQGREAVKTSEGGVITVLPQLAGIVGLQRKIGRFRGPVVATFFDTNVVPGVRQYVQRQAYKSIDHFVVHATPQIDLYAREFGVPQDRFSFVPLQVDYPGVPDDPIDEENPFVFATGSGDRDYATLFAAVERLGYPTKIVAGERILAGLTIPKNVEILDVPRSEIRRLMRRATVNVVPLAEHGFAAGLVTYAETLRVGRCLVATDRPGTDDYVIHGKTGLTCEVGDPQEMAEAIEGIWTDVAFREALNASATDFATNHCTDEAAGRALVEVLDRVVCQS
jgi:glycosyltransferase involved in cell wall biosynthesis